jgi:UDP-N-acetylmuramate dehydrogenase
MELSKNYSLQKLNTFGLDVTAKFYTEVSTLEQVISIFKGGQLNHRNKLILGGGSNILFLEDFYDGVVLKNNIQGIHVVKEDNRHFWVKAGGGVPWHELVESCLRANFGGIENLSLIPGTVGAAPIQNIGAYGVELKDVFEALEAVEISTGEKRFFRHEDCQFGYRDSVFKNELHDMYFIANVVLKLTKHPVINTTYGNISHKLKELHKHEPNIRDVSDTIIHIRQSKLPDPAIVGNAGSFFKNPVISGDLYSNLKVQFPEIPSYDMETGHKKIPAAWLIDMCQMKGFTHKGAAVHTNQPLVLINNKNATGKDLIELALIIQNKVKGKFNIELEPEVKIV